MVEMGRRFREHSTYAKFLADNPEKMAELGRNLLKQGGILVAEKDGQIVGMLGYILHEHFISGEKFCGEVFWWVDEQHRGPGVELLKAAESAARAAGAKQMQMIAPTKRVEAAYRYLGYQYVEATYQKAL